MENNFKPFENDTQSKIVGPDEGLTFENGNDSIVVYGDFNINKDDSPEKIDEIINILQSIKEKLSLKPKKQGSIDKP